MIIKENYIMENITKGLIYKTSVNRIEDIEYDENIEGAIVASEVMFNRYTRIHGEKDEDGDYMPHLDLIIKRMHGEIDGLKTNLWTDHDIEEPSDIFYVAFGNKKLIELHNMDSLLCYIKDPSCDIYAVSIECYC